MYCRRLSKCCSVCLPVNLTYLADEIEQCVDEPEEMSVDDAEDITRLNEFLEGVSVDGPPSVTVSQWIGERPLHTTTH